MVFVWEWRWLLSRCTFLFEFSVVSSDKRQTSSKLSLVTSRTCASFGFSLATPLLTYIPVHTIEFFHYEIMRVFFFSFSVFSPPSKRVFFCLSVLICSGRQGVVTRPCFPESEPTQSLLSHSLTGQRSKQEVCIAASGISLKSTLIKKNSLQFYSINKTCSKSWNLKRRCLKLTPALYHKI